MSSSLVPPKTRRVEGLMHVKFVGPQTSSRWCVLKLEERCQLKCRLRHLNMARDAERPRLRVKRCGVILDEIT
ncbi:hypothetical protein TNCV_2039401 [Trichonephila clavipes]|nr:hypothetical protein TNCV_2039401 [Trichonephila clavipes]